MTTAYPYILVVNPELPAKTLQELVALAKSKPDAMNYGSTGVGPPTIWSPSCSTARPASR